ncbi:Leucine-rich repeat-containing protein 58 [Blattella germanica]|nr:Leucine-rich repeat-containing protein 58 [Blattella germanica]
MKSVFFDNRVEHIKFVDFCGKYRIPLLQYLCSSKCIEDDTSRHLAECSACGYANNNMMKKVLLG